MQCLAMDSEERQGRAMEGAMEEQRGAGLDAPAMEGQRARIEDRAVEGRQASMIPMGKVVSLWVEGTHCLLSWWVDDAGN
jgi:hypothetical protein